ncbi:MAG: hypothetical protein H7249_00305 [Chitinophagaceae bacterium]|nr:hypothetical protein [Oligoflexus sp.]
MLHIRQVVLLLLPLFILQISCGGKKKSHNANATLAAGGSGDSTSTAPRLDLPPTVEAGPLRLANREIFLDAVSTNAVSWSWEQLAGPGIISFQSPDTEDTAVVADRDGFYWLRLTVTSANGQEAFDDVQLLWDTAAPCPTLSKDVKTFQAITVDGRVASDASIMEWTQLSGPGRIAFGSPKAGATTIGADLDGSYQIRLTASDKVGNTCSADMTFIWETTVPTVSIGQDIFTNKEVFINAATIDASTYSWTQVSGPGTVTFSSPSSEDTKASANMDGEYLLRLTITTSSGLVAFDEVKFVWDATPPTVNLGQDMARKYRATIDAQTSGGSKYVWKKIAGPGNVIFSSADSEDTALIVDHAGDYTIGLSVTDQAGNTAMDTIVITFDYDIRVFAKQVSAGGSHSCAVLDDDSVACWGYNYAQELGYGDANKFGEGIDRYMPPSFPINLGPNKTAKSISVNYAHSCAILNDDSVKCWGQNASGQLGYGDAVKRGIPDATPINLGPGHTAKSISTGLAHTCVILDNNAVKCWGANSAGQLGYGDYQNRLVPLTLPIDLGAGRTAKSLSLGAYHTCAILDDSSLKCWGNNSNGQLGYGDKNLRPSPEALAIDFAGVKVKTVASGAYHTCVVLQNGTVKCWGRNKQGQLGLGDSVDRLLPDAATDLGAGHVPLTVSAGLEHTCSLFDDGTVQCWGGNSEGQLGTGDNVPHIAATHSPISFGQGRLVKSIAAGRLHTCAVLDDSTLKCWGSNAYGQLGSGKIVNGSTPPPTVIGYGD